MTLPETVSADYTLRPSELAEVLALWSKPASLRWFRGRPGGEIDDRPAGGRRRHPQVCRRPGASARPRRSARHPWRDSADRTRWAPPVFLPPSDDPGLWLINLEELPSAVPMVQAALHQLLQERKCGEYELPEGASLIACGNRENDRGVVHRMSAPLSNRLVHLEIRVDARDWLALGRGEQDRSGSAVLRRAGAAAAASN